MAGKEYPSMKTDQTIRYSKKRTVMLALTMILLLLFTSCSGNQTDSADTQSAQTADTQSESAPEASEEESDPGASEEESDAEIPAEQEASVPKDVMILYTSDVHCGVDQGFGYAGLEQIRKHLQAQGYDVILVDNGDNIQGDLIGSKSKGEVPIDLMNKMGYNVAIPGNHEFDYGMDQFLSLAEKAEFPYISCNFQCRGENVFEPYVILEAGGKTIGFVGVTTPETIVSSTPTHFQDEEGNYIYSFLQDETGEALYSAVQSAVDDAREEGAEYVIVMGHMGNVETNRPYTYADVIANTSGIDAFLDGHSHDTDQVVMKDKDGKSVPRSACGTKLQGIGWCMIPEEGELSTGIYTWTFEDTAPEFFVIENEMSAAVKEAKDELDKQMQVKIGYSAVDLTVNDPEAIDSEGRPYRMVRRAETNMGDFCVDAFRARMGADVAVLGGGSVRDNIPAGEVKMADAYRVMPFGMEACKIKVTGQQILDALEWASRSVPAENGGFLQVSGMSYEIHTYIDPTCTEDTNGMFTGITGERRVRNVMIGGEPVDPEAFYTLASTDYVVINNGDGLTAFDGAERLDDGGLLEHDVIIDYIQEDLGGTIGEEYSDPTGEDRIIIVEEEP
jgi:2',3'-cyclic-nucleotide 2'-phosphodiesterase (5'-nucleotidase family)